MSAHTLLPLSVENSVNKLELKVHSLPLVGLDPATFGTPMYLSDHTAKSHSSPKSHLWKKNDFAAIDK
jgi:hypothetical protein